MTFRFLHSEKKERGCRMKMLENQGVPPATSLPHIHTFLNPPGDTQCISSLSFSSHTPPTLRGASSVLWTACALHRNSTQSEGNQETLTVVLACHGQSSQLLSQEITKTVVGKRKNWKLNEEYKMMARKTWTLCNENQGLWDFMLENEHKTNPSPSPASSYSTQPGGLPEWGNHQSPLP